jgi:hypothetical protein
MDNKKVLVGVLIMIIILAGISLIFSFYSEKSSFQNGSEPQSLSQNQEGVIFINIGGTSQNSAI